MNSPEKSKLNTRVSQPKEWAAGVPAVVSAYKHVSAKVGPIKGSRLLSQLNQKQGFDCPGCAWPDPLGERSQFEFCENGAKAVADEATLKRLSAEFFQRHSIDDLRNQTDRWLNDKGRLVQPLLLQKGERHYRPIEWEQAYQLLATTLNALDSADEAAFYTSGRTSNEAAFLYQLFVRQFGTNNLPDCSNMCHESSGVGLNETIGVGKGTVSLKDLEEAEAIFVFGQNPGSNHPRMLSSLQAAKRNGAKIVAVNPLDETGLKCFKNPQEIEGVIGGGTALRDLFLPVKINGDVALLKGLCRLLIERDGGTGNVLDHDFIDNYCHGFDAFKQDILACNWQQLEDISGIGRTDMNAAADILLSSRKTVFCWAMGMTQHKNAVANIQLMTNLLMLQGNLGKPGAGVCPVRGHSNVQGDRTMGIWEKPSQALLDALATEFQFEPPQVHGVDTVECIQAMAERRISVFFGLGGNFFRAAPDHDLTSEALGNCELTVQVSTKLNRTHLYPGQSALILPALGRTEEDIQRSGAQVVTVENSMGVVQTSIGKIAPASEQLRSEVAIVAELANAVLKHSTVDWLALRDDYSLIRDRIARVIPGFEDFNERLERQGEFVLPNAVRDYRQFNTPTQKANFIVHPLAPIEVKADQLVMMTIRSHDQFNTTIYTDNDRYRGIVGSRRVVFINPDDRKTLGLALGQKVDINSHWPDLHPVIRTVFGFELVDYPIPQGCVAAYYPETNNLLPVTSVADKSNTPAYKSLVVSLTKCAEGAPK